MDWILNLLGIKKPSISIDASKSGSIIIKGGKRNTFNINSNPSNEEKK